MEGKGEGEGDERPARKRRSRKNPRKLRTKAWNESKRDGEG